MTEEEQGKVIHLFDGHGKNTIITNITEEENKREKKKRKPGNLDISYIIALIATVVFFIWDVWYRKWGTGTKILVGMLALFFSLYIANIIAILIRGCIKRNPFILSFTTLIILTIFIWAGPYSYFSFFTKLLFTFVAFILSQEIRVYFFSVNMRKAIKDFHAKK